MSDKTLNLTKLSSPISRQLSSESVFHLTTTNGSDLLNLSILLSSAGRTGGQKEGQNQIKSNEGRERKLNHRDQSIYKYIYIRYLVSDVVFSPSMFPPSHGIAPTRGQAALTLAPIDTSVRTPRYVSVRVGSTANLKHVYAGHPSPFHGHSPSLCVFIWACRRTQRRPR